MMRSARFLSAIGEFISRGDLDVNEEIEREPREEQDNEGKKKIFR